MFLRRKKGYLSPVPRTQSYLLVHKWLIVEKQENFNQGIKKKITSFSQNLLCFFYKRKLQFENKTASDLNQMEES